MNFSRYYSGAFDPNIIEIYWLKSTKKFIFQGQILWELAEWDKAQSAVLTKIPKIQN